MNEENYTCEICCENYDLKTPLKLPKKVPCCNKTFCLKCLNEIYEKNNQTFILFILELTFIETFNYFNGQNSRDNLKKKLKDKLDNDQVQMIEKFLNNFDKIDKFLKNIFDKQDKNESNNN